MNVSRNFRLVDHVNVENEFGYLTSILCQLNIIKYLKLNPSKDLQEEVRSLTNNLKSSQAMEQQTADREANLEEKIAKVN